MKKKQYFEIFKGMIIGFIIPLIMIGLIYLVFNLNNKDITENVISSMILFGLGINTLIARYTFKKDLELFGRGLLFITFMYVIYWVFQFQLGF